MTNQPAPAVWEHLVQWQPATAAAIVEHVRALPDDWPARVFGVGRPDAALVLPPGASGEQFPDMTPEIAPYDEIADLDDCPACVEAEGMCRYHQGLATGHGVEVQAQLDAVKARPDISLREFMHWQADVAEAEDRGEERPELPCATPPADRAAEEAYRLALSTALRLGTGANWEAIRDRAEDLVAADESAREGWEQAAIQRSRATAWREEAERAEAEVERLRVDRAAVLDEAIAALERVRDKMDVNVAEYRRYSPGQRNALDAGITELRRLAEARDSEQQDRPQTSPTDEDFLVAIDSVVERLLPTIGVAALERTRESLGRVLAPLVQQLRRDRDLAIAHDRQPYPTAWAYEQACKALNGKSDALERVERLALAFEASGNEFIAERIRAAVAGVEPQGSDGKPPAPQPVQHAPGKAIRCPECRAKGYTACMDDKPQQDGAAS